MKKSQKRRKITFTTLAQLITPPKHLFITDDLVVKTSIGMQQLPSEMKCFFKVNLSEI